MSNAQTQLLSSSFAFFASGKSQFTFSFPYNNTSSSTNTESDDLNCFLPGINMMRDQQICLHGASTMQAYQNYPLFCQSFKHLSIWLQHVRSGVGFAGLSLNSPRVVDSYEPRSSTPWTTPILMWFAHLMGLGHLRIGLKCSNSTMSLYRRSG